MQERGASINPETATGVSFGQLSIREANCGSKVIETTIWRKEKMLNPDMVHYRPVAGGSCLSFVAKPSGELTLACEPLSEVSNTDVARPGCNPSCAAI